MCVVGECCRRPALLVSRGKIHQLSLLAWLQASAEPGQAPQKAHALRKLRALTEVMNPAVGDALSGVLAVEAVLRLRGWGLDEWDALYADLPSRQLKVKASSILDAVEAHPSFGLADCGAGSGGRSNAVRLRLVCARMRALCACRCRTVRRS